MKRLALAICTCWLIGFAGTSAAQEIDATQTAEQPAAKNKPTAEQQQLFAELEKKLNNVKLSGKFTVRGRENMSAEEYTIYSAKKLPDGDKWQITAQIKYGKLDLKVPLRLDIKWAGNTPVITLDKFTIPGLGTFDARVMIHDGQYVGTWTHDDVGGQMFGLLKKVEAETEDSGSPEN